MASKVSRALAEKMDACADDEQVDVVVELQAETPSTSGTRAERVAQHREAFQKEAVEVTRSITDLGGEVLDSAWINKTLRTRIPKSALEQLAEDDRIALLDSIRTIEAEDS